MLSIGQGLKMYKDEPRNETVNIDDLGPLVDGRNPDAWLTVDMKAYYKDAEQLQKEYPERRMAPSASEDFLMVEIKQSQSCLHEFWNTSGEIRTGSRQEPSCMKFDVLPIERYPYRFMVQTVYENEARRRLLQNRPFYRPWFEFMHSDCVLKSKSNIHTTAFKACEAPLTDHIDSDYGCFDDAEAAKRGDPDAWLTVDLKAYEKNSRTASKGIP